MKHYEGRAFLPPVSTNRSKAILLISSVKSLFLLLLNLRCVFNTSFFMKSLGLSTLILFFSE